MTETITLEFETVPAGTVDALREKLAAAQEIITRQDAEIGRLRGEIENLTPPAALGYVTGVYAEQTGNNRKLSERVHCLRRGK